MPPRPPKSSAKKEKSAAPAKAPIASGASAKARLAEMTARFNPDLQEIGRDAVATLSKQLKGANTFVYDNWNNLAVGFGPGERVSDAIFSVVMFPRRVTLFFLQGAKMPQSKRLAGEGKQVRTVILETRQTIAEPEVRALIELARLHARVPLDAKAKSQIWIKAIQAKQRPRRP